jgi:hypothetical protein
MPLSTTCGTTVLLSPVELAAVAWTALEMFGK